MRQSPLPVLPAGGAVEVSRLAPVEVAGGRAAALLHPEPRASLGPRHGRRQSVHVVGRAL